MSLLPLLLSLALLLAALLSLLSLLALLSALKLLLSGALPLLLPLLSAAHLLHLAAQTLHLGERLLHRLIVARTRLAVLPLAPRHAALRVLQPIAQVVERLGGDALPASPRIAPCRA